MLGDRLQFQRILAGLELYHEDDYIIFQQYTSFSYSGSNIFDFSPELLELFGQTDVNNVLVKNILLPFSKVYLHFGRQENKKVNGNISSLIEFLASEESSQQWLSFLTNSR